MTTNTSFNHQNSRQQFLKIILPFLLLCKLQPTSYAQTYENLQQLTGHQTQVYFSTGAATKAKRMASQLDKVIDYYNKQIQFAPSVTLLILSPGDWNQYSKSVVYGMPHYTNDKTLIVAAEDNDFWKSFIPPTDLLPAAIAEQISKTYSNENGGLTMEPFFDLLAIHELGHAYHIQDSLTMQRSWMGELFVNIFLHSYIAENEPGLLPALTMFPRMVVTSTERSSLQYTTLGDLEKYYNEIAQQHPRNYGWYQCRWHMAAATIYDTGGLTVFKRLWVALKKQQAKMDDPSFAKLLAEQVHQSVADVLLKWDKN